MAKKHLILNQPNFGDLSQYNFDDTTDDFDYDNSNGLPINNDKFQNKDLYTNAVGSDLNNAIIERNLKPQGISSIKIDKIFIENIVSHGVINIDIRGYLFSYNQFNNIINASYSSINNALASEGEVVNSRFFRHTRGTLTENSDLGNLTNVEGQTIISNLASAIPTLGDGLPGQDGYNDGAGYDYNNLSIIDVTNIDSMVTRFIDENAFNPLFLVIWMKGDSDRWYEIDERKKRFQVFKIPNLDLFDTDDEGNPVGKVTTFEKEDLSNYSVTGGEADAGDSWYQGNVDHAAAFKVRDLQITITTLASAKNVFSDMDNYQQYFDLVLPRITFNSDITNPINFLNISPNNQLNNSDSPGDDFSETFPEYFPKTNIGFYDSKTKNLQTNYLDLQSFYENSPILSLQTSAPATIGLDLSFVNTTDLLMETTIVGDYFYFIIDWDDNTDKIKTLDDWLINRPNNLIEVSELQEEDLYIPQRALQGGEQIIYASDSYPSPNPYELFSDSLGFEQQGNMPPFLNASIPTATQACIELGYTGENNFQSDASSTPPGNVYWDDAEQQWDTVDIPSAYITNLDCLTPDTIITTEIETEVLNHTYTTPGIKTIKSIVFSYDEETNQIGRWKLLKSRFYLDIPINQYPDFGEVGGSNYTTIPWPYTTPVIGGVDEDSKYKKSVQDTLSGGKIIDVDLIDEKFLINDLENDELGKSIKEMDLEQVRYLNTGFYDIYSLLNITPVVETVGNDSFLEEQYLSELPFPQYFEEFDVSGNGEITNEDVYIWNIEYYRADIANEVQTILNDIQEWNELTEDELVGQVKLTYFTGDYIKAAYWNGETGQCEPNSFTWDGFTNTTGDTISDLESLGYTIDALTPEFVCSVYYPNECGQFGCTAVPNEYCSYISGQANNDAFDCLTTRPPLEDILPPVAPDEELEQIISENIITNGDFTADVDQSIVTTDNLTGWTVNHSNDTLDYISLNNNQLIFNNVESNFNLYIASPSNTVEDGKTYLVKVDIDSYTDDQPLFELGGGTNIVALEVGMNEFEWTPVFPDGNSGKVVVRRGGSTFPKSFTLNSISVQEISYIYDVDFEQYINSEYLEGVRKEFYQYNNQDYYDGKLNKFPEESSVGQIFISDNQDKDLKESCKLELNTGELTGKSIYDSSGNSNKGLLIGDYKVKKVRKGEPMRRDSFIKVPKKTGNKDGAL